MKTLAAKMPAGMYLRIRNMIEGDYEAEAKIIHSQLECKGAVLDIGCGSGELPRLLPAFEFIGVDLNESLLKAGRKDGRAGKFTSRQYLRARYTRTVF